MIYFCADDYGLDNISSSRIQQCIESGTLNKVSVFPNLEPIDLRKITNGNQVRISLHLNLAEGKCMANADEVALIADKNGNFKHTFGGLFKLSLLNSKAFEAQAYKEIKAQVLFFKNLLPPDTPFCVDSHQHTHMIPTVFKALIRVLRDEDITAAYMRIPAEPILPYLLTPSLYFTYSPVNLVKQWLLKFLWLINKKMLKDFPVPTAEFFGVLLSGKMDEKRVSKLLPKHIHLAQKRGRDLEVLFHPGYLEKHEADFKGKNIVFEQFYLSENRKIEFTSVTKRTERSVR